MHATVDSRTRKDRSPTSGRPGTATSIASPEISSVPANNGTAPNAPDEPTWSARIAVCGLHDRPNRKSNDDTCWKNRNASKNTDKKDADRRENRDARRRNQQQLDRMLDAIARAQRRAARVDTPNRARRRRARARPRSRACGSAHAAPCSARRRPPCPRSAFARRCCPRRDCECRCRRARADPPAACASPPATSRARCCAATRARTPATALATRVQAARTTARRSRRDSPAANERCGPVPPAPPRPRAAAEVVGEQRETDDDDQQCR